MNNVESNVEENDKHLFRMVVEEDVAALNDYIKSGHSFNDRTSLLMIAINGHHKKSLQFMLENGATINEYSDRNGEYLPTLMHYGMSDILPLAVKKGASIHQEDGFGLTALHISVMDGNDETSLFLLQKGANVHQPHRIPGVNPGCPLDWMEKSPQKFSQSLKFLRAQQELDVLNSQTPLPSKTKNRPRL